MVSMDDDFKISMDDIKDMVSELFGEKIEKVEASKARDILREFTEEFLTRGIEEVAAEKLTQEEEKLLADYEASKPGRPASADELPEKLPDIPDSAVDMARMRKKIEEETRAKLEAEMREKIKTELELEKKRRKEEILEKISSMKKEEASQAAAPSAGTALSYAEYMSLINMFEQSQKMLAAILSKFMKRQPVETMFFKTLGKAIQAHPVYLKKTDTNQCGKPRQDGSLEVARLAANLNSIYGPEHKRAEGFFASLREIFEERLIAIELALGIETKDDILSNLLTQLEKVFGKREYSIKLRDFFKEKIVPDTTIKPGG